MLFGCKGGGAQLPRQPPCGRQVEAVAGARVVTFGHIWSHLIFFAAKHEATRRSRRSSLEASLFESLLTI
eukprot:1612629-Pyramimonas_sp.AAC.2